MQRKNELSSVKTEALTSTLASSEAIQLSMQPGLSDFKNFSDITFCVQEHQFHLHKMIVMSRCKWFESMLSDNFSEKVKSDLEESKQ